MAQDRDEQMINASLRFIKENANLTKKEYEKFARIYIEYNEQLAKLNRELKPESREYMKRWQAINDDYMHKLDPSVRCCAVPEHHFGSGTEESGS